MAEDGTKLLERLAKSRSLWERRIAVLGTFHEIRQGNVAPILLIAERLMADEHDLIHKAVGWMLREAEKRDPRAVRRFLDRHAAVMPRTELRYAIERFSAADRKRYMGMRAATARSATTSSPRSRRSKA